MENLYDQRIAQIRQTAKKKGGMITTSEIESCGISRVRIPELIKDDILTKEGRGIYYCADELPDEFQIIQSRSNRIIFSFGTALYLWNMSDRIPHAFDITVPQGFNASRIKKEHSDIRVHYISSDKWNIGITQTKTPDGNPVRLYDRERCIIDLIKKKDRIDKQIYIQALREYFKAPDSDNVKLIRYAQSFHIESKVRDYMDVLLQ